MATIRINSDRQLVDEVRMKLKANENKYGKRFCPCVLPTKYTAENADDYVCPCKNFREEVKSGPCHCGLYIKVKEEKVIELQGYYGKQYGWETICTYPNDDEGKNEARHDFMTYQKEEPQYKHRLVTKVPD